MKAMYKLQRLWLRRSFDQWVLISGLFALAWTVPPPAAAQSLSMDWYKVSGGGGTSTGATYAVSGTVGQHDAGGPMTGGNFSLTGGFWSLITAVQTPSAPPLHITQSGNTVTVFWQNLSGWHLQQNNDLAQPANWSANNNWTTSDGTNHLNLVSPPGRMSFRLHHP
jgi:hypothetical protein